MYIYIYIIICIYVLDRNPPNSINISVLNPSDTQWHRPKTWAELLDEAIPKATEIGTGAEGQLIQALALKVHLEVSYLMIN